MSELRRRRSTSATDATDSNGTAEPVSAPSPADIEASVPSWLSLGAGAPIFSPGAFAAVAATFLACASRLWRLEHPRTPVYDETHVGRFLNW